MVAAALTRIAAMTAEERTGHIDAAQAYALQFDRANVFDSILGSPTRRG